MNNNYTPTQFEYSAFQLKLPLDLGIKIPSDDPVRTFIKVLEGVNLRKYLPNKTGRGRNGYDPYMMLKVVLFAYTNGIYSLREIESALKTDIRFMYLANEETPSFKTIGEFISSLQDNIHNIFVDINKYLIANDNTIEDRDTLYLDGTNYEANANKFSFVWKKTALKTKEKKLKDINNKLFILSSLFSEYNLKYEEVKSSKETQLYLDKLIEISKDVGINFCYGKGLRKKSLQKYYDEISKLNESLISAEERIKICGDDRNSYSKTDNDATFMHMKYDYYNNTGVFKPGYNLQCALTDEYVTQLYVSNQRTDTRTLPFVLDRYKDDYGKYPLNLVADAGYGSYNNYMYLLDNNINAYVKYNTYTKEKKDKPKRFDSINFKYTDNDEFICPESKILSFEKEVYDESDDYLKITRHYRCNECNDCPFKKECTKSEYGRTIQKNYILDELRLNAKTLLDSDTGKKYRDNRSIFAEGVYGVIKQDYEYVRLHRRGILKTELELSLVIIGFNLNKYHNKLYRKQTIIH